MDSVRDFIVDFLDINNEIPFEKVFWFILIYLFALWAVISIWVFFDARKRYDSDITSFLFALLVFLLNFPMLIFYFAVRPDIRFEDFDDWEAGGVNVPIVNFMGKEGIEMSFELRINPKKLRDTEKRSDMNVEIGWDNSNEKFRLIDRDELAKHILGEQDVEKSQPKSEKMSFSISNYFDKVSGNVKKSVRYFQDKVKSDDLKTTKTKVSENKGSKDIDINKNQGNSEAKGNKGNSPEINNKKEKKKKKKKNKK